MSSSLSEPKSFSEQLDEIFEDLMVGHNFDYARKATLALFEKVKWRLARKNIWLTNMTPSPDTEQELSQKVHELTGWETGEWWTSKENGNIPLYTSDYLLDVIPKKLEVARGKYAVLTISFTKDEVRAGYRAVGYGVTHPTTSKNLRVTLLKLVIALKENGVEL